MNLLWPAKAPIYQKMTPKTEAKTTPRQSKIDVKIMIKNDANTKRALLLLGRTHWPETLPPGPSQEPPGAAPGLMGPLKSQRLSKKGLEH